MNTEQLNRAKELEESIDYNKRQLAKWNEATRFNEGQILTNCGWIHASPESFTVLKALNIQYFTDQIKKLEDEFAKL